MARVAHEITEKLFNILNPRIVKTLGDGDCGLYAVTHAICDFCNQGEDNETAKPGDADLRNTYAQFKARLEALVLPVYRRAKNNQDITVAEFIDAFRKADPKVRETEFSPLFRGVLSDKVALLAPQDFENFKLSLEDDRRHNSKEVYLATLKKAGNHYNANELELLLKELGLKGRLYSVTSQNKGQYYDIGETNNAISQIKLVHKNGHWEWVARNSHDAKIHNDKHDAAKAKASSESTTFATLPEPMQNIMKQLNITEDSGFGKIIAMIFNFLMMLMGAGKTVSKLFNPDQPLDEEELRVPGAKGMSTAIAALGEKGTGLNQALRQAAVSPEKDKALKAVFDDTLKRLMANKQYHNADALLKSQETLVIDALKQQIDAPVQAAAGIYNQAVNSLSHDSVDPHMSEALRCESFSTRLAMLEECYTVHQEVSKLDAAQAAISSKERSSADILEDACLDAKEKIDDVKSLDEDIRTSTEARSAPNLQAQERNAKKDNLVRLNDEREKRIQARTKALGKVNLATEARIAAAKAAADAAKENARSKTQKIETSGQKMLDLCFGYAAMRAKEKKPEVTAAPGLDVSHVHRTALKAH